MNIIYIIYLVAIIILLAAVWYRDWKYPYAQQTPHWTKTIPHKIAWGAFIVAMLGMIVLLLMYFKDVIIRS
jgi:hypothetical protein